MDTVDGSGMGRACLQAFGKLFAAGGNDDTDVFGECEPARPAGSME